jgi:diadenylate cyclase
MWWSDFNSFFAALRTYTWWQVALELLIIAAPLYFAVRYLQGTRAARMMKGAAVLLVTPYLLLRLIGRDELARIEFLYGRFLLFTSLALLVVFAPELRRALMRLGETRFFRGYSNAMNDQIAALVESAVFLSKRKIGALVAIERDTSLSHLADNGTRVDAHLTPDLLNTIFFPNSPLHDLGVIVGQGRILYAGVQFPLAESGELERELGSRHRAAVGLSAESDAVLMIISEETGDISVAEKGQLIRKLSPEALRGLLSDLLGGGDPPVRGKRHRNKAPKKADDTTLLAMRA